MKAIFFFRINVSSGEKDVEIPAMVDGWLAALPFPSTAACRKALSPSLSLYLSIYVSEQDLGRENSRLLDPMESSLVKILADASGFKQTDSANKRTVANGFDGFPICNFPRRAKKKDEKRKGEKRARKKTEETFPPFIPAGDLTNEAIARA